MFYFVVFNNVLFVQYFHRVGFARILLTNLLLLLLLLLLYRYIIEENEDLDIYIYIFQNDMKEGMEMLVGWRRMNECVDD